MKKIIIGITGASGIELGIRLLQVLNELTEVESHLIISNGACNVAKYESKIDIENIKELAQYNYREDDLAANIASGSFKTDGMIVIPCSMKTLSAIANAYDSDLIVRAADVCLKEGRKTVLVPREMPLNIAHCRNLLQAAQSGCVLIPPMLTFYNNNQNVVEQIDHIIGKILMQFEIPYDKFRPWNNDNKELGRDDKK